DFVLLPPSRFAAFARYGGGCPHLGPVAGCGSMPELPDVVVYLDRLSALVGGRVLEKVRIASVFVLRSFDPPIKALEGKRALAFRRVGKRLVLGFEEDLFLVIHLMIAGRLKFKERGAV